MARRIGLFGGTFDPPHVGHVIVAQDVRDALDLDEMWFVVAARPPHKVGAAAEGDRGASAETRVRMVEAALGDDPCMRASRVELDRPGLSYTADTLRAVRRQEPGAELSLVIGADQLRAFGTWKEPEEIARLARLTVMGREGTGASTADVPLDIEYDTVEVTRIDVSSTLVRRRVAEGRSIRYLVPEAVRRIIESEGLYARVSPTGTSQGRTTC